jgi:NADPH-dependent glutamate synthase beta subunit-like oxidoreductase
VAIVGGGPAGKAAARELVKAGARVTIFEREAELGGLMRYGYPTYRMPTDVATRDALRLRDLGIEFRTNWELGQDGTLDELRRDFNAVILAVGAPAPVTLGIPGEDLPNVWQAVELLHEIRRGSRTELGHRVLVIGGGDTAMDAATTSALGGATEVIVAYRGPAGGLRALENEVSRATGAGVRFEYGLVPVGISEANGGLAVSFADGTTRGADAVVIAIGQRPNPLLQALGVATAPDGTHTDLPDVFVAGGASYGSDRLAPALASGRAAAVAALETF